MTNKVTLDFFFNREDDWGANYNSTENKFYLKFSYATRNSQRSLIVHEAIHAACDNSDFNHMLTNTSEAFAYIGQCIFMLTKLPAGSERNLGNEEDTARDLVFARAWACAEVIIGGGQPNHQQVELLRSAILSHPYYTDSGTQNAGYDGIPFSFRRLIGV